MELLAFRRRQFALGNPVPKIDLQRNDRHTLLLGLHAQAVDLPPVEQQLSFPEGIVVPGASRKIFRDVTVYQPDFAGANLCISFAQRSLPFPQALHLGADQNQSGFELVEEGVVVRGGAVLSNNLNAFPVTFLSRRLHSRS